MELLTIAILGTLFLCASAFCVNKIFALIIDGEINHIKSIIYFFAFIFCVVLFIKVPAIWFKFFLLIIIVGFDFLYEPIKNFINKEQNKNHYMLRAMKCDEVLLSNSNDWGTISEKAYCYFKMKDYDTAVELQERAVKLSKNDLNEVNKLKSYRKYYEAVVNNDVKCWFCGVMVPYGVDKCYNCGHSMSLTQNIINWLKKGGYKKLVVNIVGILLIFFLYNLILSFLSDGLKFIIHLLTIIIIAGCIVYNIFHKE